MICTLRGRKCGKYEVCKHELGGRKIHGAMVGREPFLWREKREKEMGKESSTLGTGKKNTSLKLPTGLLRGTECHK